MLHNRYIFTRNTKNIISKFPQVGEQVLMFVKNVLPCRLHTYNIGIKILKYMYFDMNK